MEKKAKWSWTSALIGATAATIATTLVSAKPKPPTFRLVSLTALRLNITRPDALSLAASATNKDDDNKDQQLKFPRIFIKKKKFPRIDADIILNVHVTNPNILPVSYSATSLSIYYNGSLLGSAVVPAGSTRPNSCQLLRLSARLNGVELAQHAKRLIADVAKRKMIINADVDICGWGKMLLWDPKFKVHVDSRIVVDPLLLDVVDQQNVSRLQFSVI